MTLSGIQVGRGWEGGKDFLPAVCRGFVLLWRWHRVISWMVCCQKPSPPSVRGEMTEPEGNISLLVSHTARGKQVLLPHRAPLGSRSPTALRTNLPATPPEGHRSSQENRTAPFPSLSTGRSTPPTPHRTSLSSAALRSGFQPRTGQGLMNTRKLRDGVFSFPFPPPSPNISRGKSPEGAEHRRSPGGAHDPLRNHFGAGLGGVPPCTPGTTQPPPSVREKNAVK